MQTGEDAGLSGVFPLTEGRSSSSERNIRHLWSKGKCCHSVTVKQPERGCREYSDVLRKQNDNGTAPKGAAPYI